MTAEIQFYSSPAGKSMVQKLPAIMQESMAEGEQWGRSLGKEIAERISKLKQERPGA
jgi:hypothetical protein